MPKAPRHPVVVSMLHEAFDPPADTEWHDDWQLDGQRLVSLYESMLRMRVRDEGLQKLQLKSPGRTTRTSAMGEEAFLVASAAALTQDDWVFPNNGQLGVLLERGVPFKDYARHLLRRRSFVDCEAVRPICGAAHNFGRQDAAPDTYITQAVGFAWTSSQRAPTRVSSIYCGPQQEPNADFNAALDFVAQHDIPVVLLCNTTSRPGGSKILRRASERGVRTESCSATDPLEIYSCVSLARTRAAQSRKATLVTLQPITAKHDSGLEQTRRKLLALGLWDEVREARLCEQVRAEVDRTLDALSAATPPIHGGLGHPSHGAPVIIDAREA